MGMSRWQSTSSLLLLATICLAQIGFIVYLLQHGTGAYTPVLPPDGHNTFNLAVNLPPFLHPPTPPPDVTDTYIYCQRLDGYITVNQSNLAEQQAPCWRITAQEAKSSDFIQLDATYHRAVSSSLHWRDGVLASDQYSYEPLGYIYHVTHTQYTDGGTVSVEQLRCPANSATSGHSNPVMNDYIRQRWNRALIQLRLIGPELLGWTLESQLERHCTYTTSYSVTIAGSYQLYLHVLSNDYGVIRQNAYKKAYRHQLSDLFNNTVTRHIEKSSVQPPRRHNAVSDKMREQLVLSLPVKQTQDDKYSSELQTLFATSTSLSLKPSDTPPHGRWVHQSQAHSLTQYPSYKCGWYALQYKPPKRVLCSALADLNDYVWVEYTSNELDPAANGKFSIQQSGVKHLPYTLNLPHCSRGRYLFLGDSQIRNLFNVLTMYLSDDWQFRATKQKISGLSSNDRRFEECHAVSFQQQPIEVCYYPMVTDDLQKLIPQMRHYDRIFFNLGNHEAAYYTPLDVSHSHMLHMLDVIVRSNLSDRFVWLDTPQYPVRLDELHFTKEGELFNEYARQSMGDGRSYARLTSQDELARARLAVLNVTFVSTMSDASFVLPDCAEDNNHADPTVLEPSVRAVIDLMLHGDCRKSANASQPIILPHND